MAFVGKAAGIVKKCPVRIVVLTFVSLFIVAVYSIYLWEAFSFEIPSRDGSVPITMDSGVEFRQTLPVSPGDSLESFNLLIGTYGRKNEGAFRVKLFSGDNLVKTWKTASSRLKDNQYRLYRLNQPLKIEPGVEYSLSITQKYKGENNVALWMNMDDESTQYALDGELQQGSACFTLFCEKTALKNKVILFSALILILLAVMIALRAKELTIMSVILSAMLIAYLSAFPLGSGADEIHHFFRAYEIANVGMVSKNVGSDNFGGDILPEALYRFGDSTAEIDWNNKIEIQFQGAALYSPLTYLPQAIGIKIAGLFTKNVQLIYRAGIYTSTLLCLILCVAALYLLPFGRKAFFVILLFPMTLEEIASISPDGMTISLAVFFIACIGYLSYKADRVKTGDIALLVISGMILSMCKIVYIVLLPLVFLIPDSKFKSKANARLVKFGLIIISAVMNVVWLRIASNFLIEFRKGVNSKEQILFVLSHPIEYCGIVIRTIYLHLETWAKWMIGSALGALNVETAPVIWLCFAVLFTVTLCDSSTEGSIVRKYDAAILMLVFLAGCLAIMSSIYVQWTAVGHKWIEGVQGRYFTPIMGVLSYSIIILRSRDRQDMQMPTAQSNGLLYYTLILCLNGMALVDVIKFYHLR